MNYLFARLGANEPFLGAVDSVLVRLFLLAVPWHDSWKSNELYELYKLDELDVMNELDG